MKRPSKLTVLMCTLSVLSVSWISLFPGQAQSQLTDSESTLIQFAPPPLSDRDRPPGRSSGGASRGQCNWGETQSYALTALVPATWIAAEESAYSASSPDLNSSDAAGNNYESVLSLTTEAYPSFWFHVPFVLDEELILEFVLQDENNNTVYQTHFKPNTSSSGIIQFSLPETAQELTIDQFYQWYFFAHCGTDAIGEPIYVRGWIVRNPLDNDSQTQIADASELEKASFYAARGIWQDALTILGELYREDPQNMILRQNWMSLLGSIGLDEIATEPLIECCSSDQTQSFSE